MPVPAEHLRKKPPVLSAEQIEAVKAEFVNEVRREMLVIGEDPRSPHIAKLLAAMPDRMRVTPHVMYNEVRWDSGVAGIVINPAPAADAIAKRAAAAAHLASFGPDPLELLVSRLVLLGVPEAEARQRAAGRILRREDGVVIARTADGKNLGVIPPTNLEYTDDEHMAKELAPYRDPKQQLARVTRMILEERARGERGNTPVAHDRNAELQSEVASYL